MVSMIKENGKKFATKSSGKKFSRPRCPRIRKRAGNRRTYVLRRFTRGRARIVPIPAKDKIHSALRRDVFYIRVPKDPDQKEKDRARSVKRKAASYVWRSRRVNAPVYVFATEFFGYGSGPMELYGPVTGAAALLWWRYHWRRQGVRVDISAVQGLKNRVTAWVQARRFVKRWPMTCRDLNTVGMKVVRMTYTEFSVDVDIKTTIKHGANEVRSLLPSLERALDGRRNSARVIPTPGDDRARSLRVTLMRKDPFAEALKVPLMTEVDQKRPLIPIGKFETGEPVLIDIRQHLMIAGRSGSGKSVIVQILMRALTRIPWVSVIGIDLGFGATELGPWEPKVEVIGKSVEDARIILPALVAELERRGDLMSERGWRTWRCSPEEPFIALLIDEMQVLMENGYKEGIITLAKLLRKYGGFLVLATQYPTRDAMPPAVKQMLQQTIGLRVKNETAEKVMFGDTAKADGWRSSKLPKHRFYIESEMYDEPIMAKSFFMSEEETDEAIATSPPAVRVNRTVCDFRAALDLPPIAAEKVPAAPSGPTKEQLKEINRQRILEQLSAGHTHRKTIQELVGVDQTTADRHLKAFVAEGKAEKFGRSQYRLKETQS